MPDEIKDKEDDFEVEQTGNMDELSGGDVAQNQDFSFGQSEAEPVKEEPPVEEPVKEQPVVTEEPVKTEESVKEEPKEEPPKEEPPGEVDYKALFEKQNTEIQALKDSIVKDKQDAEAQRKRLELYEKLKPQQPQQQQPQQQVESWVDPNTLNDFLSGDPDKANVAVNNLFELFYNKVMERLDTTAQQTRQAQEQGRSVTQYFYEANPDLKEHSSVVGQIWNNLKARPENKDRNILDILNDVATYSRQWITAQGGGQQQQQSVTQPGNGKVTLVPASPDAGPNTNTGQPISRNFGETGRATQSPSNPERKQLSEEEKEIDELFEEEKSRR